MLTIRDQFALYCFRNQVHDAGSEGFGCRCGMQTLESRMTRVTLHNHPTQGCIPRQTGVIRFITQGFKGCVDGYGSVFKDDNRRRAHRCRLETRFRGRLVFEAHRWLYHSTLGSSVMKKKKKTGVGRDVDARQPYFSFNVNFPRYAPVYLVFSLILSSLELSDTAIYEP